MEVVCVQMVVLVVVVKMCWHVVVERLAIVDNIMTMLAL